MKTIHIALRKNFWLPVVALALMLGPGSASAQTTGPPTVCIGDDAPFGQNLPVGTGSGNDRSDTITSLTYIYPDNAFTAPSTQQIKVTEVNLVSQFAGTGLIPFLALWTGPGAVGSASNAALRAGGNYTLLLTGDPVSVSAGLNNLAFTVSGVNPVVTLNAGDQLVMGHHQPTRMVMLDFSSPVPPTDPLGDWIERGNAIPGSSGSTFAGAGNADFFFINIHYRINVCFESTVVTCNDNDGDGFGSPGDASCSGGAGTDCNDNNSAINPGATEVCNGVDDNCNSQVDEGFDQDGDGIADCFDNCPATPNAGQTDSDGDGQGDACDACPFDAANDADGDGVCGDVDFCLGTAIPEATVPSSGKLNPNHWALLDGDTDFDTVTKGKGGGPGRSYNTTETGGCSCEQIIEELDLGNGHTKHGCSISAMDTWVNFVAGNPKRGAGADAVEVAAQVPEAYVLEAVYPNPFNPQTTIRFSMLETSVVKLVVYDVLGREVRVLVDGTREAGTHEVVFEAGNLPSGTYLVQLATPAGSFVQTMQLMK